jgi:PAS domain S-box-containing protein
MKQAPTLNDLYKESSKFYLIHFKDQFTRGGEALLPSLLEMPLAACVTDESGYFEMANDAFCQLYQYNSEQLVGQHFTMLAPAVSRTERNTLNTHFFASKEELSNEWQDRKKDGSPVDVFASAAYITVNNKPKKVTFLVDITRLKQAEAHLKNDVEKLKKTIKQQDEALELLLHDIKGPIGNIIAMAEFMDSEVVTGDHRQEFMDRILSSAKKAYYLADRFSSIVKIEKGEYQPNPEFLDMYVFINNAWIDVSQMAASKNINLSYNLSSENNLSFRTDRFLLNIALSNLLKNAVEASPPGKDINISLEKKDHLILQVHNSGEIPMSIQQHFFEKYTSTKKINGSGLGTYLANKAIMILGGSISFSSSIEAGTLIIIELPEAEPSQLA